MMAETAQANPDGLECSSRAWRGKQDAVGPWSNSFFLTSSPNSPGCPSIREFFCFTERNGKVKRSKSNTIPRWSQWLIGGVMLSLAVAAGCLGLVLNISYGLETSLASGVAFGLADLSKIAIPIVAGIIGWSMQMRITAVICVFVSLWAATNYYADRHGKELLSKQHAATIYADKAKSISDLRTQVSNLDAMASAEAKRGGCGQNCRDLTKQASEARQRLQEARSIREGAKPIEASGLAVMTSMATSWNAETIARSIGAIKAALFLGLIETLVWLSIPAMKLLSMAATKTKTKRRKSKRAWTAKQSKKMLSDALKTSRRSVKPKRLVAAAND